MPDKEDACADKPKCATCGKRIRHMISAPYGLDGAYAAGSERFECDCGILDPEKAIALGFRFVYEPQRNPKTL